jgi:hypothetical protein
MATAERALECAMRRSLLNWLIDFALFLAVAGLLLTGLLMQYVLPPGSRGDAVWSLTRHSWGGIHFWFAVSMLAIAVLHVILHWGWVCTASLKVFNRAAAAPGRMRRHIAGFVMILALTGLVGGFLLAAFNAKTTDPFGNGPGSEHRADNHEIRLPRQRQHRGW